MRAEQLLLLVPVLMAVACASEPRPADPPRLKSALEAESDGARRFQRGDLAVAERRFGEAERLFASIDDSAGRARNRRHLARVALLQGRADAALVLLEEATDAASPLDGRLLRGQALLAAGRAEDAQRLFDGLVGECSAACPAAASLAILRGRAYLARGDSATAKTQAEYALARLKDRDEAAETGNAWRLLAAARLAAGELAAAQVAAQSALDIDRRLAVPEKIASDWMLLGDILRKQRPDANPGDYAVAAAAYLRALDVAVAAGLDAITMNAKQALHAIGMEKK